MCELFGMSASQPVHLREALEAFRLRGGRDADNPDGWGLAWREKESFLLVKEPRPAFRSTLFEDLGATLRSGLVIAHVRKARHPPVNTMGNTHPFRSECCGKEWVFAHNGLVPEIVGMEQENLHAVCRPAGETDSEYAFCHLLSHLARDFNAQPGGTGNSLATLATASELVASLGKFNFLMSEGERLIAYGHDRLYHQEQTNGTTSSVMIATEPLSGGAGWTPFAAGELRIYRLGKLAGRLITRPHQTGRH